MAEKLELKTKLQIAGIIVLVIWSALFEGTWQEGFRGIIFVIVGLGPCVVIGMNYQKIEAAYPKAPKVIWMSIPAALAVGFGLQWALHQAVDQPRPGAFFEKSSYKARVFVHAYSGANKITNYRVPALISAEYEDHGDEDHSHSARVYRLEYIEFPNGGRVRFDDWDVEGLKLRETIFIIDDDGKEWHIELTDELAK